MESILVSPKTKTEFKLIISVLEKTHACFEIITDEEKEDVGLLLMMSEVDLGDTVSREEIMKKLDS
jgi:hypothetical protein